MNVKVEQKVAVEFLTELGVKNAAKLSPAKISSLLLKAPTVLEETEVTKEFRDLFRRLKSAKTIEIIGGETAPSVKVPSSSPGLVKEKTTPVRNVDEFGCRVGTISNRVNRVLTKEWKDETVIAKEAGVSLEQARGRLYYGVQLGLFDAEKVVRYRLRK